VASPVLIRYTMTAYVGDRRLYGWGVYAATHFDILVEVVLKLLPDSMLLGSNHGRLVWNLKGFRESGSVSRRTDSGTEQCAPALTLTVTARNQQASIHSACPILRSASRCTYRASFRRSLTDSVLILRRPSKFVPNTETIQQAH
jgi:hypothetical protein